MNPRLVADAIVVLHSAFIAFAVLGGLLVLRWPRLAWLHLPALAWGLWIELSHGVCPLTPLENQWRIRAGEAGYRGGFIDHYLLPLIYPAGLQPWHQLLLAAALAGLNLAIYRRIFSTRRRAAAGVTRDPRRPGPASRR